jgi:uncharacterized iron-regulated membrane protein
MNEAQRTGRSPRRVRGLLKTLHLWLGMSLGTLLSLVALSGAVLTFEQPLLRLAHPELTAYALPTLAAQGEALTRILQTPEGKKLRSLALPDAELPVWKGSAPGGGRVYFDPAEGRLLLHREKSSDPMLLLLDWHTHLLSGKTGETVLGIVALGGLYMILSGVYLYWPGRQRMFRHLRPHRQPATLRWASWHRMVGVIALPLLLVTIGTGTTMAYRGAVRSGLAQAFGEPAPRKPQRLESADGPVDWSKVLVAAQAAAPDGQLTRMMLPLREHMPLVMRVRRAGEWNLAGRSTLWIDAPQASVVGGEDARRLGRGGRLANALFPIHSATVGGVVWHALVVTGGLLPGFLLVTGVLFWWRRRHRS